MADRDTLKALDRIAKALEHQNELTIQIERQRERERAVPPIQVPPKD